MKQATSIPRKKIFLSFFFLTIVFSILIYSCHKSDADSSEKDALATNAKFLNNEWPTFMLTKQQIARYLDIDIPKPYNLISVLINSNVVDPKTSMELTIFGDGGVQTLSQDPNKKTLLNAKLVFSPNLISLSTISSLCRSNGQWVNNFEYIRLIPKESKKIPGYISFTWEICNKEGKIIQSSNHSRMLSDGDGESNPSPPFCADNTMCAPGDICVSGWCRTP